MAKSLSRIQAIKRIEKHGLLLVYPVNNRAEPRSLWSEFFPDSEMRWEWDSAGDDRVAALWHLKTELSGSGQVVYAKWYRGRATFFSKSFFVDLLSDLGGASLDPRQLSAEARKILETLESDSPLSTKDLKLATDLRGKFFATTYERALRELWRRLLIVGFGEFEDGAFPSLAIGATRHLFEELWREALETDPATARGRVNDRFPAGSPVQKFLRQLRN